MNGQHLSVVDSSPPVASTSTPLRRSPLPPPAGPAIGIFTTPSKGRSSSPFVFEGPHQHLSPFGPGSPSISQYPFGIETPSVPEHTYLAGAASTPVQNVSQLVAFDLPQEAYGATETERYLHMKNFMFTEKCRLSELKKAADGGNVEAQDYLTNVTENEAHRRQLFENAAKEGNTMCGSYLIAVPDANQFHAAGRNLVKLASEFQNRATNQFQHDLNRPQQQRRSTSDLTSDKCPQNSSLEMPQADRVVSHRPQQPECGPPSTTDDLLATTKPYSISVQQGNQPRARTPIAQFSGPHLAVSAKIINVAFGNSLTSTAVRQQQNQPSMQPTNGGYPTMYLAQQAHHQNHRSSSSSGSGATYIPHMRQHARLPNDQLPPDQRIYEKPSKQAHKYQAMKPQTYVMPVPGLGSNITSAMSTKSPTLQNSDDKDKRQALLEVPTSNTQHHDRGIDQGFHEPGRLTPFNGNGPLRLGFAAGFNTWGSNAFGAGFGPLHFDHMIKMKDRIKNFNKFPGPYTLSTLEYMATGNQLIQGRDPLSQVHKLYWPPSTCNFPGPYSSNYLEYFAIAGKEIDANKKAWIIKETVKIRRRQDLAVLNEAMMSIILGARKSYRYKHSETVLAVQDPRDVQEVPCMQHENWIAPEVQDQLFQKAVQPQGRYQPHTPAAIIPQTVSSTRLQVVQADDIIFPDNIFRFPPMITYNLPRTIGGRRWRHLFNWAINIAQLPQGIIIYLKKLQKAQYRNFRQASQSYHLLKHLKRCRTSMEANVLERTFEQKKNDQAFRTRWRNQNMWPPRHPLHIGATELLECEADELLILGKQGLIDDIESSRLLVSAFSVLQNIYKTQISKVKKGNRRVPLHTFNRNVVPCDYKNLKIFNVERAHENTPGSLKLSGIDSPETEATRLEEEKVYWERCCHWCHYETSFGISELSIVLPRSGLHAECEYCEENSPTFNAFRESWFLTATEEQLKKYYLNPTSPPPTFPPIDLDVSKKMSLIEPMQDITKYQQIMTCKGSGWGQIDLTKARICKRHRNERIAVIGHRHVEFFNIQILDVDLEGRPDAFKDPKRCMVCPNHAISICNACPLKVCASCQTILTTQCKGYMDILLYLYKHHHIRNDAFMLRSDGGGV